MPLPAVQNIDIPNFASNVLARRKLEQDAQNKSMDLMMKFMELGNKQREMGIKEEDFALKKKDFALKTYEKMGKEEKDKLDLATELFGRANDEGTFKVAGQLFMKRYPDEKEFLNGLFPDGQFNPQVADSFKRMLMTASDLAKENEIKAYSPGSALYKGDKKVGQVPHAPSDFAKAISESEAAGNTITPEQKAELYMQNVLKKVATKGQRISLDKDGNLTIEEGDGVTGTGIRQAPGLGIPATNEVQKDLLSANKLLMRLNEVESTLEKQFLTVPGKIKGLVLKGKDMMNMNLTPEEKKFVGDQATFAQNAVENINQYIHELTGAQMSEPEARRLRKAVADIGDAFIMGGDSYEQFKAKLKNQMKKTRLAIARLNYVNKNGLTVARDAKGKTVGVFDSSGDPIEIESMPAIMRKRADEIDKELTSSGVDPSKVRGLVKKRLESEFGLIVE